AQLLSAAVAGADVFERERRRADELALLQELSGAITGKLDQRELLESAGARLLQLVEADLAVVYAEEPAGEGELRLSWAQAKQGAGAEEMTLVNEVSRSFAGALEIKPLLRAAGQTLRKLVDASNWFVLLLDPAAQVLRVAACSPEHESFMRGVQLRLDQPSLSAEVVRTRRAAQAQGPMLEKV